MRIPYTVTRRVLNLEAIAIFLLAVKMFISTARSFHTLPHHYTPFLSTGSDILVLQGSGLHFLSKVDLSLTSDFNEIRGRCLA